MRPRAASRWHHPALQPGWIDRPHQTLKLGDMVESQRRLLDSLRIRQLAAVVGASMGGMQALQWGVSDPDRMRSIVALVPMARTRPWSVAMNEVARRILMADPGWPSGPYGGGFDAWPALSRVITNRTPGALESVAADAVPGLVTEAIAMARRAGPDPVDWSIRAGPMMRTMSGQRPDMAATRRLHCEQSARQRCFLSPNWTSTIRSTMRWKRPGSFRMPRWYGWTAAPVMRLRPPARHNWQTSAAPSANS